MAWFMQKLSKMPSSKVLLGVIDELVRKGSLLFLIVGVARTKSKMNTLHEVVNTA